MGRNGGYAAETEAGLDRKPQNGAVTGDLIAEKVEIKVVRDSIIKWKIQNYKQQRMRYSFTNLMLKDIVGSNPRILEKQSNTKQELGPKKHIRNYLHNTKNPNLLDK